MSGSTFFPSTTQKTRLLPWEDSQGKVWIEAVAGAALTALTPVFVICNEYGNVTAALSDVEDTLFVGVPIEDAESGDTVVLQIGGYIEDVITPSLSVSVGHAFKIYDGAIADVGADYTGSAGGEFAVCTEASTSSTTQNMMLYPFMILTST